MKLEYLAGGEWQEHSHPPLFKQTAMSDNGTRLIVGVPAGDVEVMRKLAACLEQPYYILYVLLTPRGEENAGRYQSPLVERSQLDLFLTKYAAYLRSDGRFNLWVHSPSSEATLVWDHHNLLYAYGPLAGYEEFLRSMVSLPVHWRSPSRMGIAIARNVMRMPPPSCLILIGGIRNFGQKTNHRPNPWPRGNKAA